MHLIEMLCLIDQLLLLFLMHLIECPLFIPAPDGLNAVETKFG